MTDITFGSSDTLAGSVQPVPPPSIAGVVWASPQVFYGLDDLLAQFVYFAKPHDFVATPEELGHTYLDLT